MSQGTPSREGRIERHLMRQRGAGVRAITADFGFSFALPCPPSIAQQLDRPAQPPTKRRRTNETISPERHSNETPEKTEKKSSRSAEAEKHSDPTRLKVQDHDYAPPSNPGDDRTTTIETIPNEQSSKATKKAPRARRKLCLDDIVEQLEAQQNDGEVRTGGLEDTFIFGYTPNKRQPKFETEEGAGVEEPKQKKKAAPRAKKTTKAKKQLENKLEADLDAEPAAQIEKPEKKPKATRKKAVASKSRGATEVDDPADLLGDDGADRAPDDSGKLLPATDVLLEDAVRKEPKSATTKPAYKRAPKRFIDEVVTAAEGIYTATPDKPAKRPRRQAAISATEKVAMGYEDELIPADKLRRAPVVESKPKKSRKGDAVASSANALSPPPLTAQVDLVTRDIQDCDRNASPSSPPVVVKRGRKPGLKTATGHACEPEEQLEVVEPLPTTKDDEESPPSPKVPAKRGRKPGVAATKGRARGLDKQLEVVEHSLAKHLSPTKDADHASNDEPPLSPNLPAKRGRKPGVKAAKGRSCKIDDQPEVVEPLLLKHVFPAKGDNHTPEEDPPLALKQPAKRGRKPGLKAAKERSCVADEKQEVIQPQPAEQMLSTKDDSHASDNEQPPLSKLPAKRGRKPGSKNRKTVAATNHEKSFGAPAATEPASHHLSPAQNNDYATADEPTSAPKIPAKRGRKPGSKNRKATTTPVEPPVEPIATKLVPKEKTSTTTRLKQSIDTSSESQATRTTHSVSQGRIGRLQETSADGRSTEPSQEVTERSRPLAKESSRESSRNIMEEQPTKPRRALADFDGNIVRKSLTVEGKKLVPSAIDSASVSKIQKSKPPKKVKELAAPSDTRVDNIRAGKAQLLPQLECSLNEGPSHETTTSLTRRRVISADEDVDWLFEKSESRHPKPATSRQSATKPRRKAAVQSANDIDVDDLVATVDGLAAGELLTGRRGCVVAS